MADACFSITCQVGLLSLGFCQKITAGKYEVVSHPLSERELQNTTCHSIVSTKILRFSEVALQVKVMLVKLKMNLISGY